MIAPASRGPNGAAGGAVVAVLLFIVYALGANRTIHVGDSGELVTAAGILGIPHPSGYPVYVLLGRIWIWLVPFGSVAFRMSLLSAACASAACGVLYVVCRRIPLSPTASIAASGLAGLAPSLWSEAGIQRTYGLNALFLTILLLLFQRWLASRAGSDLVGLFLICGLGAGNHLFMGAAAICAGLAAVAADPTLARRPGRAAACIAAFGAGLLPYLYLPLRSRADPPLDWGNPETPGAFARVLLRLDYWDRAWIETPADLAVIAGDYLWSLGRELAWGGGLLAIVGALRLARRRGRDSLVMIALLVMLANVVILSAHGSRADLFVWHRYYIPSFVAAALLAGAGCQALLDRLPRRAAPAALLLPLYLLVTGWHHHDLGRYRVADAFSRILMDRLPPGAHLVAGDDNILFPLMYLHFVEGVRPDVHLVLQGVGAGPPAMRLDPDAEPLFMTHHPAWNMPGVEVTPVGLVFQVHRAGTAAAGPAEVPAMLDGEEDPGIPRDYLTRNLIGHFHYMRGISAERSSWPEAREEFLRAARAAPDNDVLFYNLGLVYRRNGLLEDSLDAFRRSVAINPREIPGPDRVRASDRAVEVERELGRLAKVSASLAGDGILSGVPPESAAWHSRMAELLEGAGEPLAARGHRLKAIVRPGDSP